MWRNWNLGRAPVRGEQGGGVAPDPLGPWWEKYRSVAGWGSQTPVVALEEIATLDEAALCWRLNPA